jgi:hypothetical protein
VLVELKVKLISPFDWHEAAHENAQRINWQLSLSR